MYLCPTCNKTFKVKGSGKKVKCKTCGQLLEDMEIGADEWSTLDAAGKEQYIQDMFEFVDEGSDNEPSSDAGLMSSLFDMMDDVKKTPATAGTVGNAGEVASAKKTTQATAQVSVKNQVQAAGNTGVPKTTNNAVASQTKSAGGASITSVMSNAGAVGSSSMTANTVATDNSATVSVNTTAKSGEVDTKALAAEVALLMKRYHMKVDMFMVVVTFFLPFIGWLIYACNAGDSPKQAKKVMIISLVGSALYVIGYIVYYALAYGF